MALHVLIVLPGNIGMVLHVLQFLAIEQRFEPVNTHINIILQTGKDVVRITDIVLVRRVFQKAVVAPGRHPVFAMDLFRYAHHG